MKSDPPKSPRFIASVAEILFVVAIVSTQFAFLFPAVEAARESQQRPPVLPQLQPLHEGNPWPFLIGTPIVVTAVVATFLGIVRFFVPKTVRRCFPWTKAPKPPTPPSKTNKLFGDDWL